MLNDTRTSTLCQSVYNSFSLEDGDEHGRRMELAQGVLHSRFGPVRSGYQRKTVCEFNLSFFLRMSLYLGIASTVLVFVNTLHNHTGKCFKVKF